MKLYAVLAPLSPLLVLAPCSWAGEKEKVPATKTFYGKSYALTFQDEFSGPRLETNKWQHRILGATTTHKQILTEDAVGFDGQGSLAMRLYTKSRESSALPESKSNVFPGKWIPHTSMLKTRDEFTFGYHEVRVKMPIVKGVGMSVWMQSRGQTSPTPSMDPKAGVEIDLIEQTFFDKGGLPVDFRHSTIHWGGYAATHQWVSVNVEPKISGTVDEANENVELNLRKEEGGMASLIHEKRVYRSDRIHFRDDQFHTVAVLWTPEFYEFFYDGESIGVIKVGVSHFPGYMILWPRLYDFATHVAFSEKGLGSLETTQSVFLVDYYRVYQ